MSEEAIYFEELYPGGGDPGPQTSGPEIEWRDGAPIVTGGDGGGTNGYDVPPYFNTTSGTPAGTFGQVTAAIRDITGAVSDVGKGVLGFKQAALSLEAQRAQLGLQRQITSGQLDVIKAQAASANDIAKINASANVLRARGTLAQQAAKTQLLTSLASGGYNSLILILTAAGVLIAWAQLSKGKK